MSCSNQMVDESFHLCGWNSPCYTSPRFPSVFRCQPFGLGRTFRTPRSRGSGTVGCCFPRPSHQQFGVTSSFPSTPTFSESHLQFLRDGSIRQFISSGLPQEARGDPLSISVHASMGASLLVSWTHSPSLCMLVWELLYWCHHRNIHIQVRHIPGKLNVLADILSRPDRILPTEWCLDREIAHQIFSLWGTPQIDLFATRLNHLLPLFVSPVPDHRACAVDAMSLEWKNLFAYAFPPFKLVPLVLNKIRDSNSRFILIAFESHNGLSQGTSGSSGFGITTSGKSTPSESSYVASSRLEVVRSQIRGRHISEFTTQCISQSRRESTLKVYSAR